MKKLILTFVFAILLSTQSYAVVDAELDAKLATIGFGRMFSLEPKEQVTKVIENYVKYGNKHNINKIKTLFDSNYVSADGFRLDAYLDLIKQTWDMYPNIVYSAKIQNIVIDGDYATVQTSETVKGTAKNNSEYMDDKGELESTSQSIYYLKKAGNSWLIISDTAISEKTFIKYGEAKNIAFDIVAPGMVGSGQEYSILFAADAPRDKILLGSITNEKITYPSTKAKDVFRKLKDDGMLERVVRANSDGYNEQAVVAVGVTKTEVETDEDIKLKVSGVAFLMTRVNVVQVKKVGAIKDEQAQKL